MWLNKKRLQQASEALKEDVRQHILAFQEGAGAPGTPFTADMAILSLQHKIDELVRRCGALNGFARLRIAGKREALQKALGRLGVLVTSAVYVGAKQEGHDDVCYVALSTGYIPRVLEELESLDGVFVRDWSAFTCV